MAEFKDEIVGGDGQRYYKLINDSGEILHEKVKMEKNYEVTQEGSKFGAIQANNILFKSEGGVIEGNLNVIGTLQKNGVNVITTSGGTIGGNLNVTGNLQKSGNNVITTNGGTITGATNFTGDLKKDGYDVINDKVTTGTLISLNGWNFSTSNSKIRKIGKTVFLDIDAYHIAAASGGTKYNITTIPAGFRPGNVLRLSLSGHNGVLFNSNLFVEIKTNGSVDIVFDRNVPAQTGVYICTSFLAE